jgi:hypothetical protein
MDSICWLQLRTHRDIRMLPGSISIVAGLSVDCLKIEFAGGAFLPLPQMPQSGTQGLLVECLQVIFSEAC